MAARVETIGLEHEIAQRLPWLDGVAATLERAFAPVVGADAPRGIRDLLYGTWLGHPLHAAVVTAPVGSWTAAAIFDLLREERAADLCLALGLVSAGGAVITGAAQWQDATSQKGARRLGALHAVLNGAATTLMAGSWVLRKRGQRGAAVALSATGLGINLASAWLGGELSYSLGVGVDHAAFEKPPTRWTTVAPLDDLQDGTPLRVAAKGAPVMLLRQGDKLWAIGATCPHLGGPLDEGRIDGETVTCPWHGSVFSLADGALIHGPAVMPVAAYEVRVENGQVAIRANARQAGGTVMVGGDQLV
ncbi:MAG: Rieske 2Fe-2S domain-containing protein [Thermomicrobiales bacterium]